MKDRTDFTSSRVFHTRGDNGNFAPLKTICIKLKIMNTMNRLKILGYLMIGLPVMNVAAQSPEAMWANIFDGPTTSGDQAQATSLSADGNVYWHLLGGSIKGANTISYAGSELFNGVEYEGTSQNNNLCILKTDRDGNKIWDLHSTSCDYANNQGTLASTSDGGVIFSAKLRSTDGSEFLFNDISFVDGKGKSHSFSWEHNASDEKRFYQLIIGRISPDGELMWLKSIQADRHPADNADIFIADAIYTTGMVTDDEDNAYICGNFRTPITISGSTLNPQCVAGWTGNAQSTVGDAYLFKIDGKNGNAISLATPTVVSGNPTSINLQKLHRDKGSIYAQGLVYGDGASLIFGNRQFNTKGYFSPVIMELDKDLDAKWITAMEGSRFNTSHGFQNAGINTIGDILWLTAQFTGTVAAGESVSASTVSAMREGLLVKIDRNSGEVMKAVSSRPVYSDNIAGYFMAIQNPSEPENVYVYGYNMATGGFLRQYDSNTLESDPLTEWMLASSTGTITCQGFAYSPERGQIFISGRSNKAMTICGDLQTSQPTNWGIALAGIQLPSELIATGVGLTAVPDNSDLMIYGNNGKLTILNSGDRRLLDVFDISGRRVATINATDGRTCVELGRGIYFVDGKKLAL